MQTFLHNSLKAPLRVIRQTRPRSVSCNKKCVASTLSQLTYSSVDARVSLLFRLVNDFLTDGPRPACHSYRKLKPFNSGCYGCGLSAMPLLFPVLSDVWSSHYRNFQITVYIQICGIKYQVHGTKPYLHLWLAMIASESSIITSSRSEKARLSEYPSCIAALYFVQIHKNYFPK